MKRSSLFLYSGWRLERASAAERESEKVVWRLEAAQLSGSRLEEVI